MASNIYDLSVTASSNVTIDGTDVSGTTGKVKDGDNVMRSLGAFMAQKLQDDGGVKTTSGSANAQTVTLASGFTALAAGMTFTVKLGYTNTSTTVTLNVNSIGAKSVKVNFGGVLSDPIPGDMRAGAYGHFIYDGTYMVLLNAQQQARYAPGTLYGLTLSNNSSDATNDIDIAVGSARSSDDSANMDLLSALTKRLDASWAVGSGNGGLDTGSVGNNTYYIWLIKRSDTGVVDALFSTSATAPTMPSNYDLKALIGYFVRASSTNGKPVWFGPWAGGTGRQGLGLAGYVKLGTGLIIQWGRITSGASVTFPVAFPTLAFICLSTVDYNVATNIYTATTYSLSVTGVNFAKGNVQNGGAVAGTTDAFGITWLAIGW